MLKEKLKDYCDSKMVSKFIELEKKYGDNTYFRNNPVGHFTGSVLIFSPDGNKVLLNHHKKLDMWMQFGGHADGDKNLFAVACREGEEESGVMEYLFRENKVVHLSIHSIPQNKKEDAHLHYDVRYAFIAKSEEFKISNESRELKWVPLDCLDQFVDEEEFFEYVNISKDYLAKSFFTK